MKVVSLIFLIFNTVLNYYKTLIKILEFLNKEILS